MKPALLSQFLNDLSRWPKTQSELDDLAERIGKGLQVQFVAIYSQGSGTESTTGLDRNFGFSFTGSIRGDDVVRGGLREFLRRQFKNESLSLFEQVQISSEIFSPLPSAIRYLTQIRLIQTKPYRNDSGAIIVGNDLPLDENVLLSCVAVGQRLTDVAVFAELEASIQMRNQFLSIASHELKTPLTSIYGILQLQERMLRLKKDQPSFPEQERHHDFLKMIIRQVERLNELINGLLDVSRIQNGRFMIEPSDTDVTQLLKESIENRLNLIAREASVKLIIEPSQTLRAWVDPLRMEEVIMNLVMNAIRFSPEGGTVRIRLKEDGEAFRLQVSDQGPSLPIEDRERIFQPFERAPRTSRMGGLGLGLFISRQVALLHGGNVSFIESVPGKGNVLEAYFPIQKHRLTEPQVPLKREDMGFSTGRTADLTH